MMQTAYKNGLILLYMGMMNARQMMRTIRSNARLEFELIV